MWCDWQLVSVGKIPLPCLLLQCKLHAQLTAYVGRHSCPGVHPEIVGSLFSKAWWPTAPVAVLHDTSALFQLVSLLPDLYQVYVPSLIGFMWPRWWHACLPLLRPAFGSHQIRWIIYFSSGLLSISLIQAPTYSRLLLQFAKKIYHILKSLKGINSWHWCTLLPHIFGPGGIN